MRLNHCVRATAQAIGFVGGIAIGLFGFLALSVIWYGYWIAGAHIACWTLCLVLCLGDRHGRVLGLWLPAYWLTFSCVWLVAWMQGFDSGMYSHVRPINRMLLVAAPCSIALALVFSRRWQEEEAVLLPLICLLCCGVAIAYLSGPGGSGAVTRNLLEALGLSGNALELANFALRKCLHFCFYGGVAAIAWWLFISGGAVARTAVWAAGSIVLTLAAFEESRQLLVAGRGGAWSDVAIDVAGAALALSLLSARHRLKSRPVEAEK